MQRKYCLLDSRDLPRALNQIGCVCGHAPFMCWGSKWLAVYSANRDSGHTCQSPERGAINEEGNLRRNFDRCELLRPADLQWLLRSLDLKPCSFVRAITSEATLHGVSQAPLNYRTSESLMTAICTNAKAGFQLYRSSSVLCGLQTLFYTGVGCFGWVGTPQSPMRHYWWAFLCFHHGHRMRCAEEWHIYDKATSHSTILSRSAVHFLTALIAFLSPVLCSYAGFGNFAPGNLLTGQQFQALPSPAWLGAYGIESPLAGQEPKSASPSCLMHWMKIRWCLSAKPLKRDWSLTPFCHTVEA